MIGIIGRSAICRKVHLPPPQVESAPRRVYRGIVICTRIATGLFLILAACFKLHGFQSFSLNGSAWYSSGPVQGMTIVWELILGVWLLSGKNTLGSWLAALLTFGTFAAVSLRLGLVGKASCGCLGRAADISPWTAFGIDIVALFLLIIFHPDLEALRQQPRRVVSRMLATTGLLLLMAAGIMAGLTAAGVFFFGSADAALAYLRDEPFSLTPSIVDVGEGTGGEELQATLEVSNWTSGEIRLIGGSADCSCLTTSSLPVTIPAGETKSILIKMRVPQTEKGGRLTRFVELWTDYAKQRTIRLPVTCRIRRP